MATLVLVTEPQRGWRHATVSDLRTRLDFAHYLKDLVDVHSPDAERIVLAMEQLTIHSPASLSAAFPPTEAKRLGNRAAMEHAVAARATRRNARMQRIAWRFTTADARITRRRLYPAYDP